MKSAAVTMFARPVRPPAETPVELSMYAVTVDVPSTAPATVPIASASRAWRARGSVPSRSSPAWFATPTSVPTESNSASTKKTRMTGSIAPDSAPPTSS